MVGGGAQLPSAICQDRKLEARRRGEADNTWQQLQPVIIRICLPARLPCGHLACDVSAGPSLTCTRAHKSADVRPAATAWQTASCSPEVPIISCPERATNNKLRACRQDRQTQLCTGGRSQVGLCLAWSLRIDTCGI